MNAAINVKAWLDRLPAADGDGRMTGPDPTEAGKLADEILKQGRDAVSALVDALVPADEHGDDWKVRYMLHILALRTGATGDDSVRRIFTETVAAQLGGDRPKEIQAYLIRELQVAGGREVVAALGKLLLDEDLCDFAAQALVAINHGAADQLRAVLPKATGKPRTTIIQNLGALADSRSLDAIRSILNDADGEARLAAAYALANSGQGQVADALLGAVEKAQGVWQRDQMTNNALLLAERLVETGRRNDAERVYGRIRDLSGADEHRHARQAALRGLLACRK